MNGISKRIERGYMELLLIVEFGDGAALDAIDQSKTKQ